MPIRTILRNTLKLFLLSMSGTVSEKTIPILLYHSIDDSDVEDSVSPVMFSRQMEYLHREGYRTISLDEIDCYANHGKPAEASKVVVITFDDGYRSVLEAALPILQKYDYTAGVFLPTKYVGKYGVWTKPSTPLLTWDEICMLKDCGIQFASHGHSHRDLTALTIEGVRDELELSKKILEDKLARPVSDFAYPFSRSSELINSMAFECGYRRLFSGIDGEGKRTKEDECLVRRRSVIKKDDMLSFKFVLADTYPHYFRLKRLLCWAPRRVKRLAMREPQSDAISSGA